MNSLIDGLTIAGSNIDIHRQVTGKGTKRKDPSGGSFYS